MRLNYSRIICVAFIASMILCLLSSEEAFADVDPSEDEVEDSYEYNDDGVEDLYDMLYANDSENDILSDVPDPYENFNRKVFAFNETVDNIFVAPTARTYLKIPQGIKKMIVNFLHNLSEPRNIINAILQGDIEQAADSLGRFVINTTLGFGGAVDIALDSGYEHKELTFSNTFKVWDKDIGAYLVLPVLGPSSMRDVIAFVADGLTNPLLYIGAGSPVLLSASFILGIDLRSGYLEVVEDIDRNSLDKYAQYRAMYLQKAR